MTLGLLPRIESKISPEPNSGCWLWTGHIMKCGYGMVRYTDRAYLAHRVVYELLVGPIPAATPHLDHLCRVRSCVNPQHLEPVTNKVNLHRGDSHLAKQALQTVCSRGHPFNEKNTITERGKFGTKRRCRTCHYSNAKLRAIKRKANL